MATDTPTIDLYTAQTGNGLKISVVLEELELIYKVHKIDMAKGEQKEPWYLEINPAGRQKYSSSRIPALIDTLENGEKISLFESGSITQYLISRYDKDFKISFPPGTANYYKTNSWLFFMNSSLGPMQAQSNHFMRECPDDIPTAQDRYRNETRRAYAVLEKYLKDTGADWLVGNKCTVADLACWSSVSLVKWADVDIEEFPLLKRWEERMSERDGVKRGMHVPEVNKFKEILADEEMVRKLTEMGRKGRKYG